MSLITISPGHWTIGSGAKDLIDEVTEARKVVDRVAEILRAGNIGTNKVVDNTSKNQQQNLTYLVAQHNKTARNIDASVHFNALGGRVERGIGVETLVHSAKNTDVANRITSAIAKASGLRSRGVKIRTDLAILKGTNKPCYLIEVCFVNSVEDVKLYRQHFESICQAIATELARAVGKTLAAPQPVPSTPSKPTVSQNISNGRALVRKAVAEGVFTESHKDVDSYTAEQLLRYALVYIERTSK